jgi:DNA helicase HerA-like ATPase
LKQREVILIFGKTGSGKSTLARSILKRFDRVIIFDTLEEYSGVIVLESYEDFTDFFSRNPEHFIVACRFRSELSYEYAARAAFQIQNLLLVLEEADIYLRSVSFNDPENPYNNLVKRGRHAGISLLAITQRPHLIDITLRAMKTEAITFRMDEPRDVAYLEDWGFHAEEITTLPHFKYARLSNDFESPEKNTIPGQTP